MVYKSFQAMGRLLACSCILCGGKSHSSPDICQPCQQDLPLLGARCRQCALPLNSEKGGLCGQCLQRPPAFFATQALWLYQAPIAQLISSFKYERRFAYGQSLCFIYAKSIASTYIQNPTPDLLIPTPMHWRRYLQRGFNHSEQITRQLSRQLGLPYASPLRRIRASSTQQGLNAQQRRRNLRGAFRVTQTQQIEGKHIALIDDVMTTGATAREISQLLMREGASKVEVWVLARTPK